MKTQQVVICGASFAEELGLNEAIVLQHLCYWERKRGVNEWVYNSYKIWQEQFRYLPPRAIRAIFASLVKQGLLESRKGKRGKFYRLNYEVANKFLLNPNATELRIEVDGMTLVAIEPPAEIIQPCNEDMLQQMLDIWQKKIPNAGQPLTLTPQRKVNLHMLFTTVFNSKLEQWTSFVDKITRSEFLMGKVTKFKVFLDWAVIPEHCNNILEGAYSNKEISSQKQIEDAREQVDVSLVSIEDKDWLETAKLLVQILGPLAYQSWFSKVKFKGYENNRIYLEADTKFISDWVDSHYTHKIKRIWFEVTHKEVDSVIVRPKCT